MAVSQAVSQKAELEDFGLREVVANNLQEFCAECDRFIQWQYRQIIKGTPSPEQQESHRHKLKWALRTAKLLECVASDPDSASSPAVALLRTKVWQLERSWKMLYEPMPEKEANRILAEVFPDES
jgi:hypothetical protein